MCTKRRIKCDLTQPTCKKCEKKGFTCPGYGPCIRWAGGVAIRGKLKGLTVPVLNHDSSHRQLRGPDKSAASEVTCASIQDVAISLWRPRPDQTLNESVWRFVEYYDKNIAGLMVWFDSADNYYRNSVLPRATNVPGLGLAVAAISAYHGSLRSEHETPQFAEAARDACLDLIRHHVGALTSRLEGGSRLSTQADLSEAEWMLAAIMMMSTYEMANGRSLAADSHRMAARTIVNVFAQHDACLSPVLDFLQNQLAILDVFSASTSFDLSDVENTILPPSSMDRSLFAQYLRLLHSITLTSRRMMAAEDTADIAGYANAFTSASIRTQFEQARGATLMAAGRLALQSPVIERDFIRMVDIHHHTGILYAYRSLGMVTSETKDREICLDRLFEQIAALENPVFCAQNLPWPAFVAGTESHGNAQRQGIIITLLATTTNATGFRHLLDVLHFLRLFWAGEDPDWQPLAQDMQQKGLRLLAV